MAIIRHYMQLMCFLSLFGCTLAQLDCYQFGCAAPFPPGRRNIGAAWWAIGAKEFGPIVDLSTELWILGPASEDFAVPTLNCALENTEINSTEESTYPTFQALTITAPELLLPPHSDCNATENHWCTFSGVWLPTTSANGTVHFGENSSPFVEVKSSDYVQITYSYDTYQRLFNVSTRPSDTGEALSSNASGYEPPYQWWPKTECMCGEATLPRHSYLHTNITLNGTFPDFDKSISSIASTNTKPYTSDGGRTWHIENITIEETSCRGSHNCSVLVNNEYLDPHSSITTSPPQRVGPFQDAPTSR